MEVYSSSHFIETHRVMIHPQPFGLVKRFSVIHYYHVCMVAEHACLIQQTCGARPCLFTFLKLV